MAVKVDDPTSGSDSREQEPDCDLGQAAGQTHTVSLPDPGVADHVPSQQAAHRLEDGRVKRVLSAVMAFLNTLVCVCCWPIRQSPARVLPSRMPPKASEGPGRKGTMKGAMLRAVFSLALIVCCALLPVLWWLITAAPPSASPSASPSRSRPPPPPVVAPHLPPNVTNEKLYAACSGQDMSLTLPDGTLPDGTATSCTSEIEQAFASVSCGMHSRAVCDCGLATCTHPCTHPCRTSLSAVAHA